MSYQSQIIWCLLCICLCFIILLVQTNAKKYNQNQPIIVCTTTIIADTVKNIAGNTAHIHCLMGPGIDPHLYKPIESDLYALISADIIFYNGLSLEAKMADILEHFTTNKTSTIAISKEIPHDMLIAADGYHTIFDPHIWFDINLWIYAVITITKTLQTHFPAHAQYYEMNKNKYIKRLEKVAQTTLNTLNTIPSSRRFLITGHDAFSYFGRFYTMKIISLQGISTESSPCAYDLTHIIDLIYQQKIPALFTESSIPIKNSLALAQGLAAKGYTIRFGGELYSDALGVDNSDGATYISMLEFNVKTIAQALQM